MEVKEGYFYYISVENESKFDEAPSPIYEKVAEWSMRVFKGEGNAQGTSTYRSFPIVNHFIGLCFGHIAS